MKHRIFILVSLLGAHFAGAGQVSGTIQKVSEGQTTVATGSVAVGVVVPGATESKHLAALQDALQNNRARRIAVDGTVTIPDVPEGVPLYISIYIGGSGKYVETTLTPGQTLDISTIIPDTTVGGVNFQGTIAWNSGTVPQRGSFLILRGKTNDWVYVTSTSPGREFELPSVQPGTYDLCLSSALDNNAERHDQVEVVVTAGMTPLAVQIP